MSKKKEETGWGEVFDSLKRNVFGFDKDLDDEDFEDSEEDEDDDEYELQNQRSQPRKVTKIRQLRSQLRILLRNLKRRSLRL